MGNNQEKKLENAKKVITIFDLEEFRNKLEYNKEKKSETSEKVVNKLDFEELKKRVEKLREHLLVLRTHAPFEFMDNLKT